MCSLNVSPRTLYLFFSRPSFFLTAFDNRAYTETSGGNFVEQTIREQAVMKQPGQQWALLYQPSVKCGLFRKVLSQ